jgi:hypothetical protein
MPHQKIGTAEAVARNGGVRPACACHGEPMYWHAGARPTAGGRWRCAVKIREVVRAWKAANPERRRAGDLACYVKQLLRGEQISRATTHHTAMAAVLGPRPDYCLGCFRTGPVQLSLRRSAIARRNRAVYVGRKGGRPYVLSTCPSDYAFHCRSCNAAEGNAVALYEQVFGVALSEAAA